jgi:hypothetical protein
MALPALAALTFQMTEETCNDELVLGDLNGVDHTEDLQSLAFLKYTSDGMLQSAVVFQCFQTAIEFISENTTFESTTEHVGADRSLNVVWCQCSLLTKINNDCLVTRRSDSSHPLHPIMCTCPLLHMQYR